MLCEQGGNATLFFCVPFKNDKIFHSKDFLSGDFIGSPVDPAAGTLRLQGRKTETTCYDDYGGYPKALGRMEKSIRPRALRRLSEIEVDKLDIIKIAGDHIVPFDFIEKDVVDPYAKQDSAAFGHGVASYKEFHSYPAANLGAEKSV